MSEDFVILNETKKKKRKREKLEMFIVSICDKQTKFDYQFFLVFRLGLNYGICSPLSHDYF